MITGSYTLIVAVVGSVAILIVLVHLGFFRKLESKSQQVLVRRQNALAERMVNVLKEKSPPEGDHPQPARRRLSGRDRWFRSDDSELSSPREDSPLIYSDQEFSHEEKKAIDQWEPALLSENERAERSCCSEVRNKPATLSTVPTIMSAADEALLRTFMEVLSEGLPIKIHRRSGRARKVTLWLKETDTLVWFSKRTIGTKKWHKLSLKGVMTVQAGKVNESLKSGSGVWVDDKLCLCLVFPSMSLGLELSSELERDALVQGFSMLVEDLKALNGDIL